MPAPYDGALVIDKPKGRTSHDVVDAVRHLAGMRQVGHLGTLDPLATGVLVLLLGRATRLVALLRADPDVRVTIVGHTDPSADAAADQALSLARAQRLMQTLANAGIRRERLQAEGHGSREPLADSRTAEGRARNQRVSLVLSRENWRIHGSKNDGFCRSGRTEAIKRCFAARIA